MSYCRRGPDSDVYVYTTGESIVCGSCSLDRGGDHTETGAAGMLSHLAEHAALGHKIPRVAIERLESEPQDERPRTNAPRVGSPLVVVGVPSRGPPKN